MKVNSVDGSAFVKHRGAISITPSLLEANRPDGSAINRTASGIYYACKLVGVSSDKVSICGFTDGTIAQASTRSSVQWNSVRK